MDQLYQERILAFARAMRGMEPLDDHTHEASVSASTAHANRITAMHTPCAE